MSPVPVFLGGWWPGRRGPGIVASDDSGQGKRGDGACRGDWAVRLARCHADGAVQAHALAVEVAVGDHGLGQVGVFVGLAQPLGEGHGGGQRGLHVVGRALQQRRVEDAGQDGVHADAFAHEVARDGQGHARDAGLAGRVAGLAHLPVLRRHRGRVDDGAALAVGQRLQREHARRRLCDAAEGAHQVDLDDAVEIGHGQVPDLARGLVAAGRLDGIARARAVDQDALLPVGRAGLGKARVHAGLVGHVHAAEQAACLVRQRLPGRLVEVEQGDAHAFCGQAARGGRAQARCPARDDGADACVKLHVKVSLVGALAARRCLSPWIGTGGGSPPMICLQV